MDKIKKPFGLDDHEVEGAGDNPSSDVASCSASPPDKADCFCPEFSRLPFTDQFSTAAGSSAGSVDGVSSPWLDGGDTTLSLLVLGFAQGSSTNDLPTWAYLH